MPSHASIDAHLYVHIPVPVFQARVNMATITYPITALTFDTVTFGAYTDVVADMTLILGTFSEGDDLGRVRVQNVATSTTIPVGRIGQSVEDGSLSVADNAYITVWDDFRVWAKIPYDDTATGIDYKDSNVLVGDYLTTDMPPVANCGPGFADYIDDITGLITVTFDGSDSYAMADAATITTYAWDVKDGTITVGTSASASITATFPDGFRWVGLTVTDSNGTTHGARCPVLAVDPDDDVTVEHFQVEGSQRFTANGQTIGFRLLSDVPRSTYPDGTLVMFWHGTPSGPSDRTHMKLIGWHQTDSVSIRAQRTGLLRDTVLNCVDVAGRLTSLPSFPQALQREAEDDVDIMWSLMPGLTMRRCLHYLAFWHSTALGVADFFLADELDDYPAMRLDSVGGNLFDQLNTQAMKTFPDYLMTCNYLGQLSAIVDWMLQDMVDRPSVVDTLTEDDWGELRVDYQRPPRVYALRGGAIVCSTDWLMLGGLSTVPLAFCVAPNTDAGAFGQGVSEVQDNEGLAQSQAQLNSATGHKYARLNARYGAWNIIKPDMDVWTIEPALLPRVQLNISSGTAAQRGLDSTAPIGMVKVLDLAYHHDAGGIWYTPTITWERETVGFPAVTNTPETPEVPDYEVPEPPPATVLPDFGLIEGVEMVAGIGSDGYRYKTVDFQTPSGSGGPTWTRDNLSIAATIYSWAVDPFSPGYAPGAVTGAVNGWIVNDTDIYRVTDLHGTTVAVSVHTFPVATSGASFHWRSIQASFGAYFAEGVNPWLLCVSYYGDTAGHTGTWATRSTDGGVTWSAEVQVSAFYDNGVATRFNPIGVYASPRTSGFAYTAAHVEAGDPDLLPRWAIFSDEDDTVTVLDPSPVAGIGTFAASTLDNSGDYTLYIAPPPTAVRIEVQVAWVSSRNDVGFGTATNSLTQLSIGIATNGGDSSNFANPAGNGSLSGDYSPDWTRSGANWGLDSASILTSPPTDGSASAIKWLLQSSAGGHIDNTASAEIVITVLEIEFPGSVIYVPPLAAAAGMTSTDWGATWAEVTLMAPGQGQGNTLHFPWEDNPAETLGYFGYLDKTTNLEFRLKKSDAGTITDISPVDTAISFGPSRFGFGIRAYDSDRQFLALGGIGNDTTALPADDLVGLWVSSNAGTAWANILAPVAASNALNGLEIAFGGDNSDVLFAWGGWSNGSLPAIYYSDDGGTTLDSREGNMNSLGTVALIGIAGGPTP